MTAPSFSSYARIGEPFTENGRAYIRVEHPTTHNIRKVRWYTPTEYERLYPAPIEPFTDLLRKHARGFDYGFITLITNVTTTEDVEWCSLSPARYAVDTGWYLPSTIPTPTNIPSHLILQRLSWDDFRAGQNS